MENWSVSSEMIVRVNTDNREDKSQPARLSMFPIPSFAI